MSQAPEQRCSLYTRTVGEEPAGTAPAHARYFIFELPLPWAPDVEDSRHFPAGLLPILKGSGKAGRPIKVRCVVPDTDYSLPGQVRAWYLEQPEGPATAFRKAEYLLPPDQLLPLAEALAGGHAAPFEGYRVASEGVRELMVCTHGAHDVCCGSFGAPLWRVLREQYAAPSQGRIRAWRISHLGGHRFAPTLADFPEGRFWAHLEPALLDLLVYRNGPVEPLRSHYRGWAPAGRQGEQLVEREAFLREGWAWTEWPKSITAGEGGRVRIDYPGGTYEATVTMTGTILMRGDCGGPLKETPQYAVTDFRHAKKDGGLLP
jgi:hypothetical protein